MSGNGFKFVGGMVRQSAWEKSSLAPPGDRLTLGGPSF